MTGNVSDLPDAILQSPACGVCRAETDDDVDRFVCHRCGLVFDSDTLTASFLNPDDPACGEPCDNYWHGNNKIRAGRGYRCDTCRLPAGHESFHWTGCKPAGMSS